MSWKAEPSSRELILLALTAAVIFVAVIAQAKGYPQAADNFGDSAAYIRFSQAIRHWNFEGLQVKQFWGVSYLTALLAAIAPISDRTALLLISFASYLISTLLARRLWNGWIAGFFTVINFDWLQRALLGGSEALSVALLFGAFLAVRKERWPLAAFLAALSTITRPLGIFALVGIGLVLLWKRDFRKFALATTIGLAVGALYMWPLARYFGDPLATVSSYHSAEWQGGWLFGLPFYAIIKGTIMYPAPWTNLVLSFGWILLVLFGIVAMATTKTFRQYARLHPVEVIFLIPYLWCLYAYNYPYWARGNFARFAIPIIPFVLLALYRWVPEDRRALWLLGVISPALAAASAIGIRNIMH